MSRSLHAPPVDLHSMADGSMTRVYVPSVVEEDGTPTGLG